MNFIINIYVFRFVYSWIKKFSGKIVFCLLDECNQDDHEMQVKRKQVVDGNQ